MPLTTGLIDRLPVHGVRHAFESRADWLGGRTFTVGASEAAALWSEHPYLSLYRLWAIKSGIEPLDARDTGLMRRGRRLEVPILEELADAHRLKVEHWPQNHSLVHPDKSLRLSATLDGLALDDEDRLLTVQVKSVGEWGWKRWPRGEADQLLIPTSMEVQTQCELDCAGVDRGLLVVLFGMDMDRLEVIPFFRHDAFIEALHEKLRWFWALVDDGEQPPVDGSDSTTQLLKQLYPEDGGATCELPGDSDLVARSLEEVQASIKELEKREQQLKNQLVAWIGDSTYATTPSGEAFSYKEQSRAGVDSKALKADFPEAYAACEKVSKFRVLRRIKAVPNEALA